MANNNSKPASVTWPSETLRQIKAGSIVALVTLPIAISAGYVAYAPFGAAGAHIGVQAALYAAIFAGVAASLLGRSIAVISSLRAGIAVIQSQIAATLLLIPAMASAPQLALAVMAVALAFAGLFQLALAFAGLERIARMIPYPVMAGFVNGVALLILQKQFTLIADAPDLAQLWQQVLHPEQWAAKAAFAILVGAAVFATPRLVPRLPGFLAALFIGTAAYHAFGALAPGLDLGPTLQGFALHTLPPLLDLGSVLNGLAALSAGATAQLLLSALTLAALATIESLLVFRMSENLSGTRPEPRRDIIAQGAANLLSSLFQATAVCASPTQTVLNYRLGGRGWIAAAACGVVLYLLAVAARPMLQAVPVVVLSALAGAAAVMLLDRWSLRRVARSVRQRARRDVPRAVQDAVVIGAVTVTSAAGYVITGALLGFVMSCFLFVSNMSRPVVRRRLTGCQVLSRRVRAADETEFLVAQGRCTVILELDGVLFFGNSDALTDATRNIPHSITYLALDFRRVRDIDTSCIAVLRELIEQRAGQHCRTVLCGVAANLKPLLMDLPQRCPLTGEPILFDTQDSALEAIESQRLARSDRFAPAATPRPLAAMELFSGLTEAEIGTVRPLLKSASYRTGEPLCRAGEASDRIWLLSHGSVSVFIPGSAGAPPLRIAARGPGTSFGEMGMIERETRSATVVADEAVDVLVLTRDDFDLLSQRFPIIAAKLFSNIARQLSGHLRVASIELSLRASE
jgi:SulP family sulfate permease